MPQKKQARGKNAIPSPHTAEETRPAHLLELCDEAAIGACTLSPDGAVLDVNATLCRMLGVERAVFLRSGIAGYIHPDERARFRDLHEALIRQPAPRTAELHLQPSDGAPLWVHVSGAAIGAADAAPACTYIFSDITERRAMQEALLFFARLRWSAGGEDVIHALTRFLAQELDVDYACIAAFDEGGTKLRTLAVFRDGVFEQNATVPSDAPPFRHLEGSDVCIHAGQVRSVYQRDEFFVQNQSESFAGVRLHGRTGNPIGVIALAGRKPLRLPGLAQEILGIAAVRVTGELERRKGEERLRRSEARLEKAQALGQVGTWELDLRTDLIWGSEEAFRIFGAEGAHASYLTLAEVQAVRVAEDRAPVEAAMQALLQRDEPYLVEYRIIRQNDRQLRSIRSRAEVQRDETGKPLKVIGVMQDITEEKRAEEELRTYNRRLNLALNASRSGFWEWDIETNNAFWSDEVWHLLEMEPKPSGASFQTWIDIIHPEDRQRVITVTRAAIFSAGDYTIEYRLDERFSPERWLMSRGTPILDESGTPAQYIGIVMDISDRKQAEKALLESENRYRTLVEEINDVLFELDRDGTLVYISPAIETVTGFTPQEAIGMNLADFIHADDLPAVRAKLTAVLKGEFGPAEYRILSKDGPYVWVRSSSRPIMRGGQAVGVRGVLIDISAMKRIQEDLRKAHQRLETLWTIASLASTDLRDVSDQILDALTAMTDSEYGFYGFIEDEQVMNIYSWSVEARQACNVSEPAVCYNLAEAGIWAEAVRQRRALIINRYANDHPGKKGLPAGHIDLKKLLVVPCISHGRITALAAVANKAADYNDDDVAQVNAFLTSIQAVVDRQHAEEALRISETGYRHLFEDSPVAMQEEDFSEVRKRLDELRRAGIEDLPAYLRAHPEFAADCLRSVRIVAENKTSRKLRGERSFTAGTRTLDNQIPMDHLQPFIEELIHLAQGQTAFTGESVFIHADGEYRDVWISWSVAPGYEENLAKVIVTLIDITERKQADKQLRESEARFKAVSEYSHNAIGLIDEQGKILWVNEAFVDLGGYTRTEILDAENFTVFLGERTRDFVIQNFMKFVRREPYDHHYSFDVLRADGEISLCEKHMTDYEDRSGKRILAINMVDVTERRRAEKALQDSETRFRQIFETSTIGISLCDLDGCFFSGNPAILDLLGYTQEEYCRLTLKDISHPDDAEEDMRLYREMIAGERESYVMEKRNRKKSGEYLHGQLTCAIVRDANGVPLYTIGMFEDISKRKQAEEEQANLQQQLLQAQRIESVGRLAGGVAHDYNNMLGIILGHCESAMAKTTPQEEIYHDLQEIYKAASTSADLTRQLLAFARKQTASPKVIDLTETVGSLLKMLRRLIGEDIDLVWKPGADLWNVRIDPSQVDQIMANLVINARDAILGHGNITIETRNVIVDPHTAADLNGVSAGEYVLLSVSDSGHGMNRETLTKIFEPFFTTKELGKGTGLGLATVYGIVKQNEGGIHVYSEPGHGSVFKIYLPRVRDDVTPAPIAEILTASEKPAGGTILLVEDEEALLELTGETLTRQGYTVLTAGSPEKALEIAQERRGTINLLITDVVMPGMNGRELLEALHVFQPDLKCLFMSGYTADIISNKGVLPEGMAFIQKPFRLKELSQKVREVIGG